MVEDWTTLVRVGIAVMVTLLVVGITIMVGMMSRAAGFEQMERVSARIETRDWDSYHGRVVDVQMARNVARMHYETLPVLIGDGADVMSLAEAIESDQRVPWDDAQEAHEKINRLIFKDPSGGGDAREIIVVRDDQGNVTALRIQEH